MILKMSTIHTATPWTITFKKKSPSDRDKIKPAEQSAGFVFQISVKD